MPEWTDLEKAEGRRLSYSMKISVGNLRTENLENPAGIDARNPRLSWQITSDGEGVKQTDYRIQCMSGGNLIWDSWN